MNGKNYDNVDTTTLEGIKRAEKLELMSSGMADIIVSPDIREVSDFLPWDNQGRIFAFFRHPIERDLAQAAKFDNFMTRFILNKPTGVLNFVDLGHVKKIIRERVVVGLADENV